MLPTFEQVMLLTSVTSGAAAFELPECRAYYDLLTSLPDGARVVEIGLQFGRSSSIVMQLQKTKKFVYYGVDPFTDPAEAQWHFKAMLRNLNCDCTLYPCKTSEIPFHLRPDKIDLLLVDGDHSTDGIATDCRVLVPNVRRGGYALFHDYGTASLPDVHPEVNKWMRNAFRKYGHEWKEQDIVGTLGIWKRL